MPTSDPKRISSPTKEPADAPSNTSTESLNRTVRTGTVAQIAALASDERGYAFYALIGLCLILASILGIQIYISSVDKSEFDSKFYSMITYLKIVWAGLCALPPLIMIFISSISRAGWQTNSTLEINLNVSTISRRLLKIGTQAERHEIWLRGLVTSVKDHWNGAIDRAENRKNTVYTQALLFGCIVFLVMSHCLIIFNFRWEYLINKKTVSAITQNPHLILENDREIFRLSLAILIASMTYFCISLGRILVRIAQRDISERTVAWTIRGLFMVIIATVLLSMLNQDKLKVFSENYAGYVMLGGLVAVFGEQTLQVIADKIGKPLGFPPMQMDNRTDLNQLAGISEFEISRLSEEAINNTHALAFMSTPRLYFSSPYSLPRICDWQDQAMLFAYLGPVRAKQLQEQHLVRGIVSAQYLLASVFLTDSGEENPSKEKPQPTEFQSKVMSIMGLSNLEHAVSFSQDLVYNENVARLILHSHGVAGMPRAELGR